MTGRGRAGPPAEGTPEDRLRALDGLDGLDDAADATTDHPTDGAIGHTPPTDPAEAVVAAALDRTRAELGAVPVSPLPPHVLARVDRALAAERARTGPVRRRGPLLAVAAAVVAVVAATGLAVATRGAPADAPAPTAAPAPTVPAPAGPAPRPDASVPRLRGSDLPATLRSGLGRADYGALADPARLASCLTAHGVPDTVGVLGARRVVLDGVPGVLLVLPTGVAARFRLLVVAEGCSATAPLTLADTTVGR